MREIKKILFAISLLLFSNTVFAAGGVGEACPCNQGLWCNSAGPVCMSCTTGYTDNPATGLTDPTQCYKHCNPIGPSTTPQFLNGTWNPDVINVNWSSSLPGCTYTNTNEITCNNTYFLSGNSCSSCPSCNVSNGSPVISTSNNNCVYTINCTGGYHLDPDTNTCTANNGGSATCVSNVQGCSIPNGTGTQTWNGTSWGTCTVSSCSTNYHKGTGETCDPDIYNITLNDSANGGSGGSGIIKEVYNTKWTNSGGTTITSVSIPTKSNNIFNGYFSLSSGGTQRIPTTGVLPLNTTFNDGNTTSGAATLYAQFSACTPCNTPATSHANCSLNTTGNTCNYDTSCHTGYGDTAHGGSYTGAATSSPVCTANTYTVTLDKTGGSGGISSIGVTYGQVMPQISSLPTHSGGKTFNGYYDSVSGGTQYYNSDGTAYNGQTWDKTIASPTLYAHWNTCSAGTGTNGIIHVTSVSNSCAWYIDCNAGYESGYYDSSNTTSSSSITCTACSAGYYCDGTVGVQHKACPAGKTNTSSSSSTSSASCYIKGGTSAAGTTHFCDGSNNCFYLPVDINY